MNEKDKPLTYEQCVQKFMKVKAEFDELDNDKTIGEWDKLGKRMSLIFEIGVWGSLADKLNPQENPDE
jgi:hypothetical protein